MSRKIAEMVHFKNEVGQEVHLSLVVRPAGYLADNVEIAAATIEIHVARYKEVPAAGIILTLAEADHLRDLLDLAFLDEKNPAPPEV